MAQPLIKINQTGLANGIPGQSRSDLVVGVDVEAFDDSNTTGVWNWIFVPPPDSTTTASGLTTSGIKFLPDVPGTYLSYVVHNATEYSYDEDAIGEFVSEQGGAAVLLVNGRRIPGVGETLQFDPDNGWATTMTKMIKEDISLYREGVKVQGGPFITLDFRAVGGSNVSVTTTQSGIGVVTLSGGSELEVYNEGVLVNKPKFIDFVGPGVSALSSGIGVRVEVEPQKLETYDDGNLVSLNTTKYDFSGLGVSTTLSGSFVRVQVDATGSSTAETLGTTGADVNVGLSIPPTTGQVLRATSATTATWQNVPAAEALGTTGADVDVGLSAPPTTGQVLRATSATTATWQAVPAAEALGTTGSDVDVGLSPAPIAGQVLRATSPTTATWQNFEPLTSAGGDYIQAVMSAAQSQDWVIDDVIEFDTALSSRGSLSVNASGRFSKLKAGRTYWLTASMFLADAAAGSDDHRLPFSWHDVTNNVVIGAVGIPASINLISAGSYPGSPHALITPNIDIEVELRCRAVSNAAGDTEITASSVWGYVTTALIIEIGAVQAEVVGGLEYLDTIEVATDGTAFTFGTTTGSGVLQRDIDGQVDEEYELHYTWEKANNTLEHLVVRPNGTDISASTTSDRLVYNVSDAVSAEDPVGWALASVSTISGTGARVVTQGVAQIKAKTGFKRTINSSAVCTDEGSSVSLGMLTASTWHNSTTPITSLQIRSSGTIKAGSRFVLYRRTKQNLRSGTADTYERMMSAAVDLGTNAAVEYTIGHSVYAGSLLGFSARLEDAVTVGSITIRIKIDGVTKITGVLDTTNPSSLRPAPYNVGVHKVTPNQNISVEIQTSAYDNAADTVSAVTVIVVFQNSSLLLSDPGGGRRHIKTFKVENAATTSVTFDGLDGDVDGIYILEAEVNGSSNSGAVFVRPNGLTTNQFSVSTHVDGTPSEVTDTALALTSPNATGRWSSKTAKLHAKTGKARKWYCFGEVGNSTGTESWFETNSGWWSDTTTNIISLVVAHESGAANIGIGSEFRLYKLTEGAGLVEIV